MAKKKVREKKVSTSLTFSESQVEALDREAAERGISRSDVVRERLFAGCSTARVGRTRPQR